MASALGTRIVALIFALAALALAIAGTILPFLHYKDKALLDQFQTLENSIGNVSIVTAGDATYYTYLQLSTIPFNGSEMTLWWATLRYPVSATASKVNTTGLDLTSSVKLELRTSYFNCSQGQLNIQAAAGTAVVSCVLCCANAILAIFMFCVQPVVKYPLGLYAFLAAASAAVAFGLQLHLYLNGWCDAAAMKDAGWTLDIGFILLVISCGLSLVLCFLGMFACS